MNSTGFDGLGLRVCGLSIHTGQPSALRFARVDVGADCVHSAPPLPRADASIQDSGIRRGRGRPGTTPSRYWGTAVELRGSPKLHVVFEGMEVGTPSARAVRGSSAVPGPLLPPRASAFTGCRAGERRAPDTWSGTPVGDVARALLRARVLAWSLPRRCHLTPFAYPPPRSQEGGFTCA